MKIVLNSKFSGLNLNRTAEDLYAKIIGIKLYRYQLDKCFTYAPDEYERIDRRPHGSYSECSYFYTLLEDRGAKIIGDLPEDIIWSSNSISRHDPVLLEVIAILGRKGSCKHGALKIVEIPDGIDYQIIEVGDDEPYSGEIVVEKGHVWGKGYE